MSSILKQLAPGSLRLDLQTSAFEGYRASAPAEAQATEPWFQLPYVRLPIPSPSLELWEAAVGVAESEIQGTRFAMPPRNVYIPSDFALVTGDEGAGTANGDCVGVKRPRDAQVRLWRRCSSFMPPTRTVCFQGSMRPRLLAPHLCLHRGMHTA